MNWQTIIDKLIDWVHKIQAKFEELVQKVQSILSHVPGILKHLLDGFEALWNKMIAKVEEFWDWLNDKLAYTGNVTELDQARETWETSVGLTTYNESRSLDTDSDLLVDDGDKWQGSAADAYRQRAPEQVDAIQKISQTFVTGVTGALESVKNGLLTFWIGVIAALVLLYGAFVLALGSAATVVGAIASPEFIIGGVIAFVIAGGAGIVGLKLQMESAQQALHTMAEFNNDPWPTFTLNG